MPLALTFLALPKIDPSVQDEIVDYIVLGPSFEFQLPSYISFLYGLYNMYNMYYIIWGEPILYNAPIPQRGMGAWAALWAEPISKCLFFPQRGKNRHVGKYRKEAEQGVWCLD